MVLGGGVWGAGGVWGVEGVWEGQLRAQYRSENSKIKVLIIEATGRSVKMLCTPYKDRQD